MEDLVEAEQVAMCRGAILVGFHEDPPGFNEIVGIDAIESDHNLKCGFVSHPAGKRAELCDVDAPAQQRLVSFDRLNATRSRPVVNSGPDGPEEKERCELRDVLSDLGSGPPLGVRNPKGSEATAERKGSMSSRVIQRREPVVPGWPVGHPSILDER